MKESKVKQGKCTTDGCDNDYVVHSSYLCMPCHELFHARLEIKHLKKRLEDIAKSLVGFLEHEVD